LINCDDHQKTITKQGKKYEDYRPDVTHQCLLALLDTPLNKAGLLQIFIRTQSNVLIEINPMLKVPRTFKRFSAFMAMLLTKLKVRSAQGSATLATVIKNPVTLYLPMGVKIVGTSNKAELVNINRYVETLGIEKKPFVFVIGAVSTGNPGMENDLVTENISISKHGLSAAVVCGKICTAMEKLWRIV
jgi:rRNA small subunit pseudouridine methyltransferase Nep1